jgi:hypothetical protein
MLSFAALLGASAALAQPAETSADEIFRRAREAAKRGDFQTACAGFEVSQRLDPAPGTLLNLGDCAERRGNLVQALAYFDQVRGELPDSDPRARVASLRAAALEVRVPRLFVRLTPGDSSGARLRVEPALPAAAFDTPLRVDPGVHRIVVRARDGGEESRTITLREGEATEVTMSVPTPASELDAARANGHRTLGFVVGAGGLACLAAGIVAGVVVAAEARVYKDHCDARGCDPTGMDAASTGRVLGVVSPIALVVGAAGLGVGAYLVLTGRGHGVALRARASADWVVLF